MIALADAAVVTAYVGLGVAAMIALWRIVTGPTLADRVIALDLALVVLMVAIAVDAIDRQVTTWLNLLVVIAIVGFTATVAATQFIERDAISSGVRHDRDGADAERDDRADDAVGGTSGAGPS